MESGDREDLAALLQEWRLLSKKPLAVSAVYDQAAVTRMSRHIARSAEMSGSCSVAAARTIRG
jgi:hypothetical protein